jgi:hypothetical protein
MTMAQSVVLSEDIREGWMVNVDGRITVPADHAAVASLQPSASQIVANGFLSLPLDSDRSLSSSSRSLRRKDCRPDPTAPDRM